jgi:hypothetical protein
MKYKIIKVLIPSYYNNGDKLFINTKYGAFSIIVNKTEQSEEIFKYKIPITDINYYNNIVNNYDNNYYFDNNEDDNINPFQLNGLTKKYNRKYDRYLSYD